MKTRVRCFMVIITLEFLLNFLSVHCRSPLEKGLLSIGICWFSWGERDTWLAPGYIGDLEHSISLHISLSCRKNNSEAWTYNLIVVDTIYNLVLISRGNQPTLFVLPCWLCQVKGKAHWNEGFYSSLFVSSFPCFPWSVHFLW